MRLTIPWFHSRVFINRTKDAKLKENYVSFCLDCFVFIVITEKNIKKRKKFAYHYIFFLVL